MLSLPPYYCNSTTTKSFRLTPCRAKMPLFVFHSGADVLCVRTHSSSSNPFSFSSRFVLPSTIAPAKQRGASSAIKPPGPSVPSVSTPAYTIPGLSAIHLAQDSAASWFLPPTFSDSHTVTIISPVNISAAGSFIACPLRDMHSAISPMNAPT